MIGMMGYESYMPSYPRRASLNHLSLYEGALCITSSFRQKRDLCKIPVSPTKMDFREGESIMSKADSRV